jgi:hypothetical protein
MVGGQLEQPHPPLLRLRRVGDAQVQALGRQVEARLDGGVGRGSTRSVPAASIVSATHFSPAQTPA